MIRKKSMTMVLLLMLMVAIPLQSSMAANRSPIRPTLTFIGSTAKCEVIIRESGKTIQATLELWRGNTRVAAWAKSGTGYVIINGSYDSVPGIDYTLTVKGTIGGVPIVCIPVTGSY